MSDQTNCPDCNAKSIYSNPHHPSCDGGLFYFKCGSGMNGHQTSISRTDLCLEREKSQKLARLLRLVLPHIPASAIDVEKARTHKIDECYLNTMVREALEQGGDR